MASTTANELKASSAQANAGNVEGQSTAPPKAATNATAVEASSGAGTQTGTSTEPTTSYETRTNISAATDTVAGAVASPQETARPHAHNSDTIQLRAPPSLHPSSSSSASPFTTPPLTFTTGAWHVTHSTLPMWKSKSNVIITYDPLPSTTTSTPSSSTSSTTTPLNDLVTYTTLSSSKIKSVHGISTPDPNEPGTYDWRGKGWLMIASSHWEVLGWGEEEGGWMVTFFAKTLFTPRGLDVYARRKGGLSAELVERLLRGLGGADGGDGVLRALVAEVFEVRHDW